MRVSRFVLLALLVLSCRCESGDSGTDDAGLDDAGADDVADRPDVDDNSEDASEDAVPEDAGLDDASESTEDDGAESSDGEDGCGRDVTLWERELGESWCYDPPTRDLTPIWETPSPGCERVTYCGGSIDIFTGYDVAGSFVAFIGPSEATPRGIIRVDTNRKADQVVEPWETVAHNPGVSTGGAVAYAAYNGEATPRGSYVLVWDGVAGRKQLIQRDPAAGGSGNLHTYYTEDFDGRFVLVTYFVTSGAEVNLRTIDPVTLENLPLTDFASGIYLWGTEMAGDLVVYAPGSSGIYGISLTDRSIREIAPSTSPQWDPTTDGSTVCWSDLRAGPGGPEDTYHRGEIYCTDLSSSEEWNASNSVGVVKGMPTVLGEWTAWTEAYDRTGDPDGPPHTDIVLHNRRLGRRFSVLARAPAFLDLLALLETPRLSGDYVYFLGGSQPSYRPKEVYRCNLRTLFPEAYE